MFSFTSASIDIQDVAHLCVHNLLHVKYRKLTEYNHMEMVELLPGSLTCKFARPSLTGY